MRQVAIDFETFLINECEGSAPTPVCLSYYDGKSEGVFVGSDIPSFLSSLDGDEEIIAHNVKFEFSVILKHYPELTDWVLEKLDKELVWCTLISEQIRSIALPNKIQKFTLASLVESYLGEDISETKTDPDAWRTRYSELAHIPLKLWPQAAVDYSIMDSKYTYQIRQKQQVTHVDSVRASVCLGMMADRGFQKRPEHVKEVYESLRKKMGPMQEKLIAAGFAEINKKGEFKKKTKAIRDYLENNVPGVSKTDKGNVSTDKQTLAKYKDDSVMSLWVDYMHLEKLTNTYIKTIQEAESVVRTDYNVVVDTCRTSARASKLYPALNVQNIPRGDGIRECFGARKGFKLVSIDYSALELVCAAQQLFKLYKKSAMLEVLNEGEYPADLHSALGCRLMSEDVGREVSYEEFLANKKDPAYGKYRTMAKPLNLGYPGGIGPKTMARTAKESYGIDMTQTQAAYYRKVFFQTYPEFQSFLKHDIKQLCLSGQTKSRLNPSRSPFDIPEEYYYKYKKLVRRGCSYSAACNGFLMQTPAAFGTKRMLWRLLQATIKREDIYPLAFIHDEVLFEIKDDNSLDNNVEDMAYLMIDSMKEILPDVRVVVESDMGDYWSKEGMGSTRKFWK